MFKRNSARNVNYRASRRSGWAPNQNTVRHRQGIVIGPMWQVITMAFVVTCMGLLFVSQSSSVTTYGYRIAGVDGEISNLEAERDALRVENARIHAAAAKIETNATAKEMEDAESVAYVKE